MAVFRLKTVTTEGSFHRVEKVQKVEQVVTSKQFVQSGQSFIVETGDPDADAVCLVSFHVGMEFFIFTSYIHPHSFFKLLF